MTYDVALWKPKARAADTAGLIALLLGEGIECKAVSRFPRATVVRRLEEIFACSISDLPFEADVTGRGAILGLASGDSPRQVEALAGLARELGLYLYDFQEHGPSASERAEFQRRLAARGRSADEQTFLCALEAAAKGSSYDMHLAGSCYRYGTGVTRDLGRSIEWYERAAESGMTKALVSLADMYREDLGDESSLQQGYRLLGRAVAQGNLVALAMLAEWTRDGVGVTADAVAAVALWRKLLDADACVAAFELAKAHEQGSGVDRSTDLAIDYYRRPRAAGHPDALRNLRRLGADE